MNRCSEPSKRLEGLSLAFLGVELNRWNFLSVGLEWSFHSWRLKGLIDVDISFGASSAEAVSFHLSFGRPQEYTDRSIR